MLLTVWLLAVWLLTVWLLTVCLLTVRLLTVMLLTVCLLTVSQGDIESKIKRKAPGQDTIPENGRRLENAISTYDGDSPTLERSGDFASDSGSLTGLWLESADDGLASNQNNNVRDDSDSDDMHCSGGSRNGKNRKLHFITFLAGSNELHCVFQPCDSPQPYCNLQSTRRSCSGRCSPEPCPYPCPSEKPIKCQVSPAFSCSRSSLEDSVIDWLRCKERFRYKDSTEKLFGTKKCCRKLDPPVLSCSSDICCQTTTPKCGLRHDTDIRTPLIPSPCSNEPACSIISPKACCCPVFRSCCPTPVCSPIPRPKSDDCCYRSSCSSPTLSRMCKGDTCCLPSSCFRPINSCPLSCQSCLSCTDSQRSDNNLVKKYKQFRKDYVKKWGIKISNSDGGEWVYKDCDSVYPLYRRKNGKITRITLASENAMCPDEPVCRPRCDDGPKSCCPLSKRQRRGSLCRKLDMSDEEFALPKAPLVTCFIERGCPRKKPREMACQKPTACSPCAVTVGLCAQSGAGPCDKQATCSKPAACPPKPTSCPKPPGCLKQTCCPKPSCQKKPQPLSPCALKSRSPDCPCADRQECSISPKSCSFASSS
ncbi:hypothetical protein Btru_020496 [Bulinus truncatus]|nr:hypothetical protein Btru_020496 [Bulinus truncatus]